MVIMSKIVCWLCERRSAEIRQLFRKDNGRVDNHLICFDCHSMIVDKLIFRRYGVEFPKEYTPEWVVIEGTARWWLKQRHDKEDELERYLEEKRQMPFSEWLRLWQNNDWVES